MSNEIMQAKNGQMTSIIEDQQIAKAFFESGIFKDVKTAAQALVKIIAGREQGLAPIQAMSNVYIFDDRIAYLTKVFSSKVKKSKKYDYKIKVTTDKECEIDFFENGKLAGTSKYTFTDAAKSGLPNKESFKKYPNNMLYNRAMSNGIKMFCPDILDGANLYEDFAEVEKDGAKMMSVDMNTGEIKEAEQMQKNSVDDDGQIEEDFFK